VGLIWFCVGYLLGGVARFGCRVSGLLHRTLAPCLALRTTVSRVGMRNRGGPLERTVEPCEVFRR
jgi:hypothetical protein